jgi:hypothetical protein
MAFGEYQMVLAKLQPGGGASIYKPEIDFRFHASPDSITYSPRHATSVRALPTGVHVVTAPTRLADITVRLTTGLEQFLATDADGNASVMGGRERAKAVRQFLAAVAQRKSRGGYRLEWHDNDRDYHYQIEIVGSTFAIASGDSSRIGGDNIDLKLTVTSDLNAPVTALFALHAGLAAAQAKLGRLAGTAALALERVRTIENVPLQAAGLVKTAIQQIGVIVQAVQDVVSGVREISAIPLTILLSARDLTAEIRLTYFAAADLFTADHWRRMGEALTDVAAETKRLTLVWQRSGPSAGALTASGPAVSSAQYSTMSGALSATESGKKTLASLSNPSLQAFAGLDAKLASYGGWTPYAVKDGDTLPAIAQAALGNAADWIVVAVLNGLSTPFGGNLVEGKILKIPVKTGGLPFGQTHFNDLATFQKAIEEFVYLRDFRLWFPYGQAAGCDIEINRDDPRGVRTITGLANYVQRYLYIVFRTELGADPRYPAVGIYQTTGKKRQVGRNLTRLSAQAQLWADPRTIGVQVREDASAGTVTDIVFDAATRLATAKLGV